MGSRPCRSDGRIFFPGVNFLCWILFRYRFHPSVTTVACKRSWSFCQRCRWQLATEHVCTLRMWLCITDMVHGCMVYTLAYVCVACFILSFVWLQLPLFGQDRGVNNNTPAFFSIWGLTEPPSISLPVLWPPPQPDHCGCWSQTGWPRSPCACPCVSWHPPHAGASGCLGGCWPRPHGSPAPPSVQSPPERSRAAEDASPCTCPQYEKTGHLLKPKNGT